MPSHKQIAKLGLGLIGIGREWGHILSPIPPENEVLEFLHYALASGVDFFDTAPAYGLSEKRFGKFLAEIKEQRSKITVATKFGEHWDSQQGKSYTDHSYDALHASLNNSLHYLEKIDIIQVHKASVSVLTNPEVHKSLEFALSCGVTQLGASISELEAGKLACEMDMISVIQLPFNSENTSLRHIFDMALARGKKVLINRPYNMGAMLFRNTESRQKTQINAFQTILTQCSNECVILSGTRSKKHLAENFEAFGVALQQNSVSG